MIDIVGFRVTAPRISSRYTFMFMLKSTESRISLRIHIVLFSFHSNAARKQWKVIQRRTHVIYVQSGWREIISHVGQSPSTSVLSWIVQSFVDDRTSLDLSPIRY